MSKNQNRKNKVEHFISIIDDKKTFNGSQRRMDNDQQQRLSGYKLTAFCMNLPPLP